MLCFHSASLGSEEVDEANVGTADSATSEMDDQGGGLGYCTITFIYMDCALPMDSRLLRPSLIFLLHFEQLWSRFPINRWDMLHIFKKALRTSYNHFHLVITSHDGG